MLSPSAAVLPWRFVFVFSVALLADGTHLRSAGLPGGVATGQARQGEQLVKSIVCADEQADVEMADPPHYPSRLGVIVHRKSGYIMSSHVSSCFDTDSAKVQRMMDPAIDSPDFVPGSDEAVYLHLARDPVDLAVSNFLYNKFTSHEPHTLGPGTAARHKKFCLKHSEKAYRSLPAELSNESLREYLTRVNNHSGLLLTVCESTPIIGSMVRVSNWCNDHKEKCMQVFLNDLMRSSETFMTAFQNIARMAGYEWTAELQDCLSYQDINDPKFGTASNSHAEHCSTYTVTHGQREELKRKAVTMDTDFMDGLYANATDTLNHA